MESGNSVLYFSAKWCAPCRAVSPLIEQVITEYPDVDFHRVDIDVYRNVADDYNIMAIPTFVILYGNGTFKQVPASPSIKAVRDIFIEAKG